MRLMALDIGERRIGIAMSDSGIIATPYDVLHRKTKRKDFAKIDHLITKFQIERLIIGLPYSFDEQEKVGPQARRIMRYAQALSRTISIPFEYFDESYSTVDAKIYLQASGQNKVPVDAAAAAVILQGYLDAENNFSK